MLCVEGRAVWGVPCSYAAKQLGPAATGRCWPECGPAQHPWPLPHCWLLPCNHTKQTHSITAARALPVYCHPQESAVSPHPRHAHSSTSISALFKVLHPYCAPILSLLRGSTTVHHWQRKGLRTMGSMCLDVVSSLKHLNAADSSCSC